MSVITPRHHAPTAVGEGGSGQVWRATDTTLGHQVAIQILPDAFDADPKRLARFANVRRRRSRRRPRRMWPSHPAPALAPMIGAVVAVIAAR